MSSIKTSNCVVNELLCVLKNNFGKYPRAEMVNIFADFYCENEVEIAKSVLCEIAECCTPKPEAELKKITSRKGDGKIRRDIDDIYNIFTVLDSKKCVLPPIVALETSRVPSINDFDNNKTSMNFENKIADLRVKISEQISDLATSFQSSVVTTIKDVVDTTSSRITETESLIVKQTLDINEAVQSLIQIVNSPTSLLSSLLNKMSSNGSDDNSDDISKSLKSQFKDLNDSLNTQVSDILSKLNSMTNRLDIIHSPSAGDLSRTNTTSSAQTDGTGQIIDLQSSDNGNIRSLLPPDTCLAMSTYKDDPLLRDQNYSSLPNTSSGPSSQPDTNSGQWLTVVKGRHVNQQTISDSHQSSATSSKDRNPVQTARRITGNNKSSTTKITSSSIGKWYVFVGRLNKDTSENDLKDHLENNNISVLDIKKLDARQTWQEKCSAFRLCISLKCKDEIMSPDLWPDNSDVRDWIFKPK
jgi:hypothetical protein